MKLEFKHLAAYTASKIEVSYLEYADEKKRINAYLTGTSSDDGIETTYKRKRRRDFAGQTHYTHGDLMQFNGHNNVYELDLKPVLRPLSDLFERISHKGEKFTPLDRLMERWEYFQEVDGDLCFGLDMEFDDVGDFDIKVGTYFNIKDGKLNDFLPHFIFELLIEWHFDVFGLLPEKLAIIKKR